MGIAEIRKKKGFSRKELSNHIGYAKVTLGRWERGERVPDGNALLAMAKILECTTDDLLRNPPLSPSPEGGKKQKPRPVMKNRHKRKAA